MRATLDHFEIPVGDSARVARFLEAVFGWAQESSDGSYRRLVAAELDPDSSKPPMRVGLYEGDSKSPEKLLDRSTPVVRLDGETLEACLERVTAAGGRITLEPREVGDSGRFARFEDPEGNPWGLWQVALEV